MIGAPVAAAALNAPAGTAARPSSLVKVPSGKQKRIRRRAGILPSRHLAQS